MKLQNEKKEAVYKYDLDCTDEEATQLKKIAIERFAKDDRAQLEYAIVSLLTDALTADVKESKAKKETKNGSKNNNRK